MCYLNSNSTPHYIVNEVMRGAYIEDNNPKEAKPQFPPT